MPQSTSTRNEQIRSDARAAGIDQYTSSWVRDEWVDRQAAAYGLSPITIRNILRGRDLQPRQPRRRRTPVGTPSNPAGRSLGINRRFGVEIEFTGVSRPAVQRMIDNDLPHGWRVKTDCSVSYANGHCGLELVSPPLQGESGLEQIRLACQKLTELGAVVNRSCGLHVHHDAADLGAHGVARVVRAYTDHQDLINWLVAPSRRGTSGYAKRMQPDDARDVERQAQQGTRRQSMYCYDRYKAVNINSLGRHGTIEVRQHQGTLSFRKIEAWIRLGQGLMDAATTQTTVSHQGLRGLLTQVVEDEDAQAFLLGRALQFGAAASVVAS